MGYFAFPGIEQLTHFLLARIALWAVTCFGGLLLIGWGYEILWLRVCAPEEDIWARLAPDWLRSALQILSEVLFVITTVTSGSVPYVCGGFGVGWKCVGALLIGYGCAFTLSEWKRHIREKKWITLDMLQNTNDQPQHPPTV